MYHWLSQILTFFGYSPTTYNNDIPNLVKVDSGLWRSGQPTNIQQWKTLKKLGITRVIKLNFESEGSDDDAVRAGMSVITLSIQPEGDKDIIDNITNTFIQPDPIRLMDIETEIMQSRIGGVLVHCTHGQDRTGLIIGRHRVLYNGWPKNMAYEEMLANNFHPLLHGLHESWERFAT